MVAKLVKVEPNQNLYEIYMHTAAAASAASAVVVSAIALYRCWLTATVLGRSN